MANEKSKYGGLLALRNDAPKPDSEKPADKVQATPVTTDKAARRSKPERARGGELSLPSRQLTGKRSSADFRQKSVLLRVASIDAAESRLKRKHKGTDFSDLMQALLEKWLDEPS